MALHNQQDEAPSMVRSRPVGFDGEQFITTLLDWIERNAVAGARTSRMLWEERQKVKALEERVARLQSELDEKQMVINAFSEHVAEWKDYSAALYNRLNAIDPAARLAAKLPKRLRERPIPPGPLKHPIPF